ncbi:uncharacterized protein [Lepisosteus oculatus]|uniref:uncharacterized protein n=1 Tax=Lepisosteus oculatus TaxID=7918 RepID=UPI00073FBB45|nr:PREDICTED: uncharacterized protein LOC107077403 [Lepisosteus oculatus]
MPYYGNSVHLKRTHSRRYGARRRSNSTGVCILPSIPEYPGFQDIKVSRSLPASANSSPVFQDLPHKRSLASPPRFEGNSAVRPITCESLKSQEIANGTESNHLSQDLGDWNGGFHEQNMQDYFSQRLMELKNIESHHSPNARSGLTQQCHSRRMCRRNSCAAIITGPVPKYYEQLESRSQMERGSKVKSLSVLDFYKRCKTDCWNKINSWRVFKS